MKNLLSILVLSALLGGCAAPKFNYQPATVDVSEPPIGEVVERQVGEELLHQGRYREYEAIKVDAPARVSWAYTVMPGYFLKIGQDDQGDFFRIGGAGDESGFVQKAAIADPYSALLLKTDNTLCVITFINAAACGWNGDGVGKIRKPIISADYIQRTLIYNGRVGEKVNIGYREFSGNAARSAFNNNVEYDLTESKEIAYRGAHIEILDANNRSIRYRVISNFNQAHR